MVSGRGLWPGCYYAGRTAAMDKSSLMTTAMVWVVDLTFRGATFSSPGS
ncbi:hypothetical protein STENM223S_07074 [Streptomyces tendae]